MGGRKVTDRINDRVQNTQCQSCMQGGARAWCLQCENLAGPLLPGKVKKIYILGCENLALVLQAQNPLDGKHIDSKHVVHWMVSRYIVSMEFIVW